MITSVTFAFFLVFAATRTVDAYSAQLFDGSACLPSSLIGYKTNLGNGDCVVLGTSGSYGGSSSKVVCQGDTVTQSLLYIGSDCQVVAASLQASSGAGDGQTCLVMRAVDGSGSFSAYIDCSAAGPEPSGGPSTAVIIGAVVGTLAGIVLIIGGGWWWYRIHKAGVTFMPHTMHMQHESHLNAPTRQQTAHAANASPSSLPPGTMPIVLLAMLCIPGVAASSGADDGLVFQFIGFWTSIVIVIAFCIKCCVPGAFRAPPPSFF